MAIKNKVQDNFLFGGIKKTWGSADVSEFTSANALIENTELAALSQEENRRSLKSKGYQLEEKVKLNKHRNQNNNSANEIGLQNEANNVESGNGLDAHPLLPDLGGKDTPILPLLDPDSDLSMLPAQAKEAVLKAKKDKQKRMEEQLKFQNKLINRARYVAQPRLTNPNKNKYKAPPPTNRNVYLPRPRPY